MCRTGHLHRRIQCGCESKAGSLSASEGEPPRLHSADVRQGVVEADLRVTTRGEQTAGDIRRLRAQVAALGDPRRIKQSLS